MVEKTFNLKKENNFIDRFVIKVIFTFLILLASITILYYYNLVVGPTALETGFVLLGVIILVFILLEIVFYFLKFLRQLRQKAYFNYIQQIKDQKSFLNLDIDEVTDFSQALKGESYYQIYQFFTFIIAGLILVIGGLVFYVLIPNAPGISLILIICGLVMSLPVIGIIFTLVNYSEEKTFYEKQDREKKDLEQYNAKFKILVADEIRDQV